MGRGGGVAPQSAPMRQWQVSSGLVPTSAGWEGPATPSGAAQALAGMVQQLGDEAFVWGVLAQLAPVLPAASWSVYRTGGRQRPTLFMSASHGIPDTTQDCWWAYLSGPYRHDRTWGDAPTAPASPRLCHLTVGEVEGEHRSRVYEAHGMAERVSVVDTEADGARFAVNFYRHLHQRPFTDAQIADLSDVAVVLLALARKHIALSGLGQGQALLLASPASASQVSHPAGASLPEAAARQRLLRVTPQLTERELDVCTRLLQGLTQEGIATDLGLSLSTVKTYRNRAFDRLGIHFRNELFALVYPTS